MNTIEKGLFARRTLHADIVVNNAGTSHQPPIEEVTAERIEKLYSIWDYAPKLDP